MLYDRAMNNGLILTRLKNVTGINFARYAPLPSFQDMQAAMQCYVARDVSPDDKDYYEMEEAARIMALSDIDPKAFELYAEMVRFYDQIKDGILPREKAFKYLDDVYFSISEYPRPFKPDPKNTCDMATKWLIDCNLKPTPKG